MSTIDFKNKESLYIGEITNKKVPKNARQQLTKPGWSMRNETKLSSTIQNNIQPISADPQPKVRLKSTLRKIIVGLIISLSALMFGYSLKEITSVPIETIISQYGITINKFATQSILIGILPLGAIIGVIITKCLITRYRRLTGIYIFTFVNIGAIVLVNITTFGTLIAGRFIEGICIGYYTTIAPIYLKEIAPKELRRMLGLFFSFGKIVGVLFVIVLELSLDEHPSPIGFRVILSMTALFSILQAVLIFFFGSDTPAEMIEKGNEEGAMKLIQQFYKEEYVKDVFDEYKKEFEMEVSKGKKTLSEDLNPQYPGKPDRKMSKHFEIDHIQQTVQSQPNAAKFLQQLAQNQQAPSSSKQMIVAEQQELTFEEKKDYAYCLGVHLCVIRHWTGGNAIITQGGLFIKTFSPVLGTYTSIIINSIQFIFVVIGLIFIQKLVGKRPLFLFSISLLSLLNIALAVAMIYKEILAAEMIMCIYMAVYGGSFISPIWAYPSEIIPASQALLPNITHWLALAISTLVPPVITGIMPDNNSYPVFLFFGFYGFLSFIHVFRYLRESDGKSYNQIIKSFK